MPNNTRHISTITIDIHTRNHNDNITPTMLAPPNVSMLEIEDALGIFTNTPRETRNPASLNDQQ